MSRPFEEITQDKRILKIYKNIETDQVAKLKVEVRSNKASDKCLVSLTICKGWEHLSVSHKNKIPSWLTMQEMKELFFEDDEECFQLHPKADDYINNNEYTLHIWRPIHMIFPTPPSILVGFRPNHIDEDMEAAKQLHEDIGMPLTDEEIRWLYLSSTPEGQKKLSEEIETNPETLMKLALKMGII